MELRGRDFIGYNPPPPQPNQEPSPRLSYAPLISSAATNPRRNETDHGSAILSPNTQTLDHHHHLLHHHNHEFNLQQQTDRPRTDPNPDPAQVSVSATITATSLSLTPPPAPPPQPSTTLATNSAGGIRYGECMKNHAASMGAHVVDGCGEFMPSGEEGTPEALKCAACDCHRNFHRRETEGDSQSMTHCYYTQNPSRNSTQRAMIHSTQAPPPPQPVQPPQRHGMPPMMMMAFGGGTSGAPAESSSEDLNMLRWSNAKAQTTGQASGKRFRTKFTQEQKDRMQEFGEKLGWRIQKQDEEEVQQFCNGVGVKRQVFKVWMHNNKQAMKKKQL